LDEALSYVRSGDTLVVWRLDRLGRSLNHLIETIAQLAARNIGFKSLTENIDTTTSGGKLIFHIFGALAEFERNLIRGRTTAGLMAARARGRRGGRPKVLTGQRAIMAQTLYDDPKKLQYGDLPGSQDLQSHVVPVYQDRGKVPTTSDQQTRIYGKS
jgi:DNA invertase Pin-like site-specific DNA recombinase